VIADFNNTAKTSPINLKSSPVILGIRTVTSYQIDWRSETQRLIFPAL